MKGKRKTAGSSSQNDLKDLTIQLESNANSDTQRECWRDKEEMKIHKNLAAEKRRQQLKLCLMLIFFLLK